MRTTSPFAPEASGDDHLAVLRESLADRIERFLHRGIDEAAGVHDHEVGALVAGRDVVALGAQLREDRFAVDERLGTAERDETDSRSGRGTRREMRRGMQDYLRRALRGAPFAALAAFAGAALPSAAGSPVALEYGKPEKSLSAWVRSSSCMSITALAPFSR